MHCVPEHAQRDDVLCTVVLSMHRVTLSHFQYCLVASLCCVCLRVRVLPCSIPGLCKCWRSILLCLVCFGAVGTDKGISVIPATSLADCGGGAAFER